MTIIEPLGARVLVSPLEDELKTASGLYLPETAKEKPQRGRIEAVGSEEELTISLEVGDVVVFDRYAGTELKFDGKTYLLMEEADILARLKEN